jgi:hypothetical protein
VVRTAFVTVTPGGGRECEVVPYRVEMSESAGFKYSDVVGIRI